MGTVDDTICDLVYEAETEFNDRIDELGDAA